jgi:ubiquinone/menaquinone biosynthesis C-methylase UbiE
MHRQTEPNNIELEKIYKYVDFNEKKVLEIGCGDGRLTYQFAEKAKKVLAIDPNSEIIDFAKENLPDNLVSKVDFQSRPGENLSFISDPFDIAFFSYSLCCMDSLTAMQKSLDEVLKKLEPKGYVIVILDSLQMPYKRGIVNSLVTKESSRLVSVWSEEHTKRDHEANFLIRQSALVEKNLEFIAEEELRFNSVYDNKDKDEALKYWLDDNFNDYSELDEETKTEIDKILESITTEERIFIPESAVITVLRKSDIKSQ